MHNHFIPVIPFSQRVFARAEGVYVFDTEGNRYLDLNGGQFCQVLGAGNAEIVTAVAEKTRNLLHTGTDFLSEQAIDAAGLLYRISGDMRASSILLSTGAETVEFCLRYAKHITRKSGIICYERGYHGLSLGAQSVTFGGKYAAPTVEDVYSLPVPADISQIPQAADALEQLLSAHAIAGVLLEPIVSVGGMLMPPEDWLQTVREITRRHGALLILDECQTGFGRTGHWFAYQRYGIVPDMVACAKGIGLGWPVGAALFAEPLIGNIHGMTHYSSHQNDPFAGAVICAGIEYIEKYDLLSEVQSKGAYFLDALRALTGRNHEHGSGFSHARGEGLMLGLDLHAPSGCDSRAYYAEFREHCLEHGLIIQGTSAGTVLRFLPAYTIEKKDIDFAVSVLQDIGHPQ
jgi:acetylornithine/succinyldiaminopimelate/putrescine aminotransferase